MSNLDQELVAELTLIVVECLYDAFRQSDDGIVVIKTAEAAEALYGVLGMVLAPMIESEEQADELCWWYAEKLAASISHFDLGKDCQSLGGQARNRTPIH